MAKKLIKYGKFLMSVALIFCLIAPSYASLSASDGAAFVTKSEFDAALLDFNSRLTTFEAGINSKIDAQVTSYLDRNGIWNGTVESLVTANTKWTYGIKSSSSSTNHDVFFPYKNDVFKDSAYWAARTQANYDLKTYNSATYNKKIIDKFSKSGLACVKYNISEAVGTLKCYMSNWDGGTAAASDHFKCVYDAKLSFLENNTEVKSALSYTLNLPAAASLVIVESFQTTPLYFFVKKDDSLYIKGEETLEMGDGTNFSMTCVGLSPNLSSTRDYNVTDVTVY